MNDEQRRKLDKGERELAFMNDNGGDFPGGSPGAIATATQTGIVAEMHGMAGDQVSGFAGAQAEIDVKGNALQDMKDLIDQMNLAATGFADAIPGSDMKFRKPRNRSQENIRATALAFHTDAAPIKATFIEWGLPPTFLTMLQNAIDAFDAAGSAGDTSGAHQAAATGGLADAAKRLMANGRKLNSIVLIKYANNPSKRAAWTVAHHLERDPKKKNPPTPPTP